MEKGIRVTIQLRPYQQRAIAELMEWFAKNPAGNPCLCMPGGSGKSVVIASIVKDALQSWPETRVLMLVHNKKLIQQNANKLRHMWPGAPLGIYSAGLKKRQMGNPITYAGIMSVGKRAKELGHQDIVIVDEAHCISNEKSGTYRRLIAELHNINPAIRVIGLSASPYRANQGMLTEGESAIFSDILYPVSIAELLRLGALCPLLSKSTHHKLDKDGLHTRHGDYISAEMNERFNTKDNNTAVALEAISRAKDRKHWMVFCSGVQHSIDFAECLNNLGVSAHAITTRDSAEDEDRKLQEFESGKVKALCNFGKYTTGYDFEALDCIIFLRATKSPGLYLQCAVRGMRPNTGKENCLVLDFAGVVAEHGPITAIQPPRSRGKGTGEAVTKTCPECQEVVTAATRLCPSCGFEFKFKEKDELSLRNDDIMKLALREMPVRAWTWIVHTSRSTKKQMLKVTYYGRNLSDSPVREYFTVTHDGYAGEKARKKIAAIATVCRIDPRDLVNLHNASVLLQQGEPPESIKYVKNGSFEDVKHRVWAT